jgi:PEP-CTERM motif
LTFVQDEVDVIPFADSAEAAQNSEPSLAVNPLVRSQMIAGAFGSGTPYWQTNNIGATWSDFDNLSSVDKSIAWQRDGAAALTTTLTFTGVGGNTQISTFQSSAANFGAPVNVFNPGLGLDQPWIRTGPGGQTYVTYNQCCPATNTGKSASIIVSSTNGSSYAAPIVLENVVPPGGQDAPSVRSAVNGSTVYAAFTRWGAGTNVTGGSIFPGSQVVVAKSINSGVSFAAGVIAAATTGYFSTTNNTPLTLGAERTGSDIAIAVDPNNTNHVVVAYGDVPGTGQLLLHVVESTDGGASWTLKFTTSSSVRSALPGLTILDDGQIALLYGSYDPATDKLSQHLAATSDDFATITDTLLGTENNDTSGGPASQFDPYLGDFFDLTSVGNTFYGIFSASNADDGTLASYLFDDIFQRAFTGTPGMAGFQLTDLSGNPISFSIDPIFFRGFSIDPPGDVPEPGTLVLLGTSLFALAALRRRRK